MLKILRIVSEREGDFVWLVLVSRDRWLMFVNVVEYIVWILFLVFCGFLY